MFAGSVSVGAPIPSVNMASPNARMALTGRPTYHVLAPDHREPWLDHMVALGIMANRPIEGEIQE